MLPRIRQAAQRTGPLHALYTSYAFRTERKLIRGVHLSASRRRSVIHYSINRSATQYSKRLLARSAKAVGVVPVHMNGYAFESDLPYLDHLTESEMSAYAHVFHPTGYLYSVFGGYVRGISEIERYGLLLTIRDPRDMLTSLYFSSAVSHRQPSDDEKASRFAARRNSALSMEIDEFVIGDLERYGGRYREYVSEVLGRPNAYVAKYEQMIVDFPAWLDGVLGFCGYDITDRLRAKLIAEARRSQPNMEDASRHKRQVIPGDHRRKLEPATIAHLNSELSDVLEAFGYA